MIALTSRISICIVFPLSNFKCLVILVSSPFVVTFSVLPSAGGQRWFARKAAAKGKSAKSAKGGKGEPTDSVPKKEKINV